MTANGTRVLANTRSVDALQNDELSQNKLFSPEARRISSVLENCISQFEIATTLSALLQLNDVSTVVSNELSKALNEHQMLSERLEKLEGIKQETEEGEGGEARKRARAKLEKDIKNSFKDLLRLFRAHPDAILALKAVQGLEVDQSAYKLIRGLKTFHSHMVERLLTSPDEELHLLLCKPVSSFPTHELKDIVTKELEIAANIKKTDEKISMKKSEIQKLQDSLQRDTQEVHRPVSVIADKQCPPNTGTSKKELLQEEIDRQTIQLNNLILENRQAEKELQVRNEKVETEIEYLLQDFDAKIEQYQADLELNEIDHEREEEEIRNLEKLFSVLEVEWNQILERRQLEEEKKQEEIRELELKTKAAILAQAWWRGYSVRKALKNKSKNKKAKKGKGKKK
ncbi:dynein regulatory complex protein 10 [Mastacembelus armatus]|uniref:Dynein regulatory complex protein 10 n=1 Tax=Mastacembelus armatus TaxID=205130 RepID=A0A7N9AT86_9TELE|nr:dynein regulatory complex protein 10 [Mastacembelus armatus]XP_026178593.1 dynein regulatory complex protein 10 [Mastacembelus armatus]